MKVIRNYIYSTVFTGLLISLFVLNSPCYAQVEKTDNNTKNARVEEALKEYEALNEYIAEKILSGRKNDDGTTYTVDDFIKGRKLDNYERMVRDDRLEEIFDDLAGNEDFIRALKDKNENMSTGSNKTLKALKYFLKVIDKYPAVRLAITAANRMEKGYLMYLKRKNRQHYDEILKQLREMTHEVCESSIENSETMGDNYRAIKEAVPLRDARDEVYLKLLYEVWHRKNLSPATKDSVTEREHDREGDSKELEKYNQEALARRMRSWNGSWSTKWCDLTIAGGKIIPTSGLLAQYKAEIKIEGATSNSIIGTWEIKFPKLNGTFQWLRSGPDAFKGFRTDSRNNRKMTWTGRRVRRAN